jgi:hypothetical protein
MEHCCLIRTAGHMKRITYFNKNTHLQVVFLLIAPPRSGPENNDIANSDVTRTEYFGYADGGTISKITIMTMEYTPDAPSP